MRIISKLRISEFAGRHGDALEPLMHRYAVAKHADWSNLADVRADFRHADAVGPFTVFNIAGDKYRLVAVIRFQSRVVHIRNTSHTRSYTQSPVARMNKTLDRRKYTKLLGKTQPVVIETEHEYYSLLDAARELMAKDEQKLTPEESRVLKLLAMLIEEYETALTRFRRSNRARCLPS